MGYETFTNNYTSPNPQELAVLYARQAAKRARVGALMANGDRVMGDLTRECCSDPAYGGAGAIALLVPGTPASTAVQPTMGTAASMPSGIPPSPFPLTPVDILTGTRGWRQQPNGKPWPHPKPTPPYGPMPGLVSLVPPCPCFGNAAPVVLAVPPLIAPNPTPAPAPPPGNCPYPKCSTGNVCLDLITGCVSNSQVTQDQVQACTMAGYSTFGNSGAWLSAILLGCGGNLPWLGTPLPNPPQAQGSMMTGILKDAITAGGVATSKARGTSGLGQVDSPQVGGFLAVVAMFGIVVWAMRK